MKRSVRDQISELLLAIQGSVKYAKKADSEKAAIVIGDCGDALSSIVQSLRDGLSEERFSFYLKPLDKLAGEILAYPERLPDLKEVKKRINQLKKELLHEPEVQLEIAFFPYKAAMWDSLESVWRAAEDDPRCDVYVVPIPYYEKGTGGSNLRMLCERDQFPDYVSTLDYRDYDIAVRKPDIAYIHNPFDGNNIVTGVHPDYFSHRLKKHVKTLVYIPYYVLGGDMSGHDRIIALTAADIVITRDEATARELKRVAPGKDVAGLGSPKADRILRYEEQKPDMPEAWRDLVGDKKLFFLNTSLSALLQSTMEDQGVRYIEKLTTILDCVEGRQDAALLWRPHPLSGATLESMRPHLLEAYQGLLNRFHEKRLGVLDESPDMNRAIALSSGYIGEYSSSVAALYAITGKPMYMLNYQISSSGTSPEQREEYARSVLPGIPCIDGDFAWAACNFYPGLLRINLKNGKAEYVAEIPGETGLGRYSQTVRAGDRLYLTPAAAGHFASYDMNTKQFLMTEIPPEYKGIASFTAAAVFDGRVFYFPCHASAIACQNTEDDSFTYHTDWLKSLEGRAPMDALFANFISINGSKAYLPCLKTNEVLEFDMESCRFRMHKVGDKGFGFNSSVFDGRYVWLAQFKQRIPVGRRAQGREAILRWDPQTGNCRRFDSFPDGFSGNSGCFGAMIANEGMLYVLPRTSNMLLRLDTATGEMTELKLDTEFDFTARKSDFYNNPSHFNFAARGEGSVIYTTALYDNSLLELDLATGSVKNHKLETDDPRALEVAAELGRFRAADYRYHENPLFSPEWFLDAVSCGDMEARSSGLAEQGLAWLANNDGSCGEKVHAYVVGRAREKA